MERLVIIDGNSLINRAFYAIQKPMISSEGQCTQGIYGFLSMLFKIRKEYQPTHMLVAFDRKAPTFRHLEYADYKAGRRKMPLELATEFPILKDVLDAMGIARYEADGWEADDIIGTTAKMAEAEGLEAYVITGDKDALQLATDLTKVLITKKGISEFKLYDDAAMIEEYGFDHQQFIDYKGLRGDTSDNIPGIPGVGEKTAAKLLLQFGSLENMLANTDQIENAKLREKIEEGAMSAVMSKRLATIITTVPVDYSIEDLKLKDQDRDRLIDLYTKLEFKRYLADLLKEKGGKTEEKQTAVQPAGEIKDYPVVSDNQAFLDHLSGSIFIDVISDNSHVDLPRVDALQIASNGCCYVAEQIDEAFLRTAFEGRKLKLNGFALQKLYYILYAYGIDISAVTTEFDISIAAYVINPNAKALELDELVLSELHEELTDNKPVQLDFFSAAVSSYADCGKKFACMESLKLLQANTIKTEDLEAVYADIELPLCKVLARMEAAGIKLDKDALKAAGEEYSERINELETEIYSLAGEEFNINSPKQLGVVLFEKMQLPGAKKTKTGYATNADVLDKLAAEYPVVEKILEYRTLSKLRSTYVEGLLPLIDPNGKVHPHFRQNVAATGRLSCTEPNLQNIPVREELGRKLRRMFTADSEDYILIGADYSQIELRILAHMSGDKMLINAFNEGHDIHKETAAKVFGVDPSEVTPQMRSNAKAVNFGVIYGMSSFGLAGELTISRKEAENYIQDYFRTFPDVKAFLDGCISSCKENGSSRTMYGRKRNIPEIYASQFMVRQLGERLAMNTPIQGSAADIMKIAMIKVSEALKDVPGAEMILQIHDELIIHAPKAEADRVKELLVTNMEAAAKLSVALIAEPESGQNWYLLK